jgi:hypothetical protein
MRVLYRAREKEGQKESGWTTKARKKKGGRREERSALEAHLLSFPLVSVAYLCTLSIMREAVGGREGERDGGMDGGRAREGK